MNDRVNMTYRSITLRLHPGSRNKHDQSMREVLIVPFYVAVGASWNGLCRTRHIQTR